MLTRLYATNYRCLVNFELKPTRKQLLIGLNGSGKTTALDVLALLRDFAARGLPCEERFVGRTKTAWQDVAEQRFEIEVQGNGGTYLYTLVVDEWPHPIRPRVTLETLEFDKKPLFRFQGGRIGLFNDSQRPSPSVEFHFDWHRSGLAAVDTGRQDNRKLTWFKQWLGRLTHVQINPWAMSARSEREARDLSRDMGNFADWYRHLRQESGNAVYEAMAALREFIPGLESLDAKEAGLDVRVVQAAIRSPKGKIAETAFSELSEGQRALIALYMLAYCAVLPDSTLLIDEPDNFVALAEIQPWLVKLLDRVDEQNAQVMLVSHHPELLDQLAGSGGILFERPGGAETRVSHFAPPDDTGLRPSEIIARGWEGG